MVVANGVERLGLRTVSVAEMSGVLTLWLMIQCYHIFVSSSEVL